MKKKTKIIIPSTILTGFVAATSVATGVMMHNTFFKEKNKKYLMFRSDTPKEVKDYVLSHQFEELEITSNDGLKLKGQLLRHENSNKLIICVHGYHSNNFREYSDFMAFYYNQGFNIFIPNNRAHGNSEGEIIGFGWLDRLDILCWINYLIQLLGDKIEIALQGISMGSATVLMLSGEELPENVKCIIADCGFSSVYNEMKHVAHTINPFIEYIVLPICNIISKPIIGYNFKEASTLKQVKKSKTPTLFIHGDQDDFVPTYMVYDLYEACSSDKDLLIVEGAKHARSYQTNKALYELKVNEFLNKYMTSQSLL